MNTRRSAQKNVSALNQLQRIPPPIYAAILLGVMCLHWWRPGSVVMQGDSVYYPAPFVQLGQSFAAWNHVAALVGNYSATCAYTVILLLVGALKALVGYSFSQIIFLWFLLCGSWYSAYRLAQRLGVTTFAAATAAWLYTVNPWSQQFYSYNYQLQILSALTPLIWLWFIEAARARPTAISPLLFRIVLTAALPASVFGINPALIGLTVAVVAPGILFARIVVGRWGNLGRLLAAGIPLAIVASLWWSIPMAWAIHNSSVTAQLSPSAWSWVTRHSSLLNNLRFEPTWWWMSSYVPYCDFIDGNILLYGSQFCLLFFALAALILETRSQRRSIIRYCVLVACGAWFISKGYHPPFEVLNDWFYHLPGAFLFREPTTKLPLLALVALIAPISLGIDQLMHWSRAPLWGRVVTSLIIVLSAAAGYPSLSGEIFHETTDQVPGLYAKLPDYWREMADALNAEPVDGAVLSLPFEDFYQVNFGWFYGSDSIADWLLRRPVVHLGQAGYAYTEGRIEQNIERQLESAIRTHDPYLGALLQQFGIRYILYRGDVIVGAPLRISLNDLKNLPTGITQHYGPLTVVELPYRSDRAHLLDRPIATTPNDTNTSFMLAATDGSSRISDGPPQLLSALAQEKDDSAPSQQITQHLVASGETNQAFFHATDLVWHRSLGAVPGKTITTTVSHLEPQNMPPGYPVIGIETTLYSSSRHYRQYEIINPARTRSEVELQLSVFAHRRLRYHITSLVQSANIIVDPVEGTSWVKFPIVGIPPGRSKITITWQPVQEPAQIQAIPDTTSAFLGALRVRPMKMTQAVAYQAPSSIHFFHPTDQALLGIAPINRPLSDVLKAALSFRAGGQMVYSGFLFDVEHKGQHYLIYQHSFASNVVFDLPHSIDVALTRIGLQLENTDFQKILVHSIGVVGSGLDTPTIGDPEPAALTVTYRLHDETYHDIGTTTATHNAGVSALKNQHPQTLVGRPLMTLVGLHSDAPAHATAEVYNPGLRSAKVQLAVIAGTSHFSQSFEIKPAFTYRTFEVPRQIAAAIRDQTATASLSAVEPAPPLSMSRASSQTDIDFTRANHILIDTRQIDVPLSTLGNARIHMPTSLPLYLGFLWNIRTHGRSYLVYEHEFIDNLETPISPSLLQAVATQTGLPHLTPKEIWVHSVGIDIASSTNQRSGRVETTELEVNRPTQEAIVFQVNLPSPITEAGRYEFQLCQRIPGPWIVHFFDPAQRLLESQEITPGIWSDLSLEQPLIGVQTSHDFAVSRIEIAPENGIPTALLNGSEAPCSVDFRYATLRQRMYSEAVISGHVHRLLGYTGTLHLPIPQTSGVKLVPVSAHTAFVVMSALEPARHDQALPISNGMFGSYYLSIPALPTARWLTTPEGWDPAWVGFRVNHQGIALAPHARVNDWANGYYVHGNETLVMINLLTLIEGCCVAFSFWLCSFMYLKSRNVGKVQLL